MTQKGRPAQQVPAVRSDLANGEAIAADFRALDASAPVAAANRRTEDEALAEAAVIVGTALTARLQVRFASGVEVRAFEQLRDLPRAVIARLPVKLETGEFATANSIKELCPLVFGRPYTAMSEAAQDASALGDAYDLAVRLGLNRSALRATRALPPEKLDMVRRAIETGGTKADVLGVIEDLAVKVEKAEAALAEAQAEKAADESLLEKKNKRIDALERKLKHFDRAPPSEQLAELQKAATSVANEATGLVAGTLRQAVIALRNQGDERGQSDHFLAGLVAQVQAALSGLREEFSLPDHSTAESALQSEGRRVLHEGMAALRAQKAEQAAKGRS